MLFRKTKSEHQEYRDIFKTGFVVSFGGWKRTLDFRKVGSEMKGAGMRKRTLLPESITVWAENLIVENESDYRANAHYPNKI